MAARVVVALQALAAQAKTEDSLLEIMALAAAVRRREVQQLVATALVLVLAVWVVLRKTVLLVVLAA